MSSNTSADPAVDPAADTVADTVGPKPTSPDPDGNRRLVLVAGAGRSGTSTVAGILQRLGLTVPHPEVESDETNPRGFSESRWVVDFHDHLLQRANVQVGDARPLAWTLTSAFAEKPGPTKRLTAWLEEQFAGADQLLIKDPRLAWFLPLWTSVAREIGIEPSFVTMLRPPAEIVGSKRTYYNDSLKDGHGVAAWLNMLLNTERGTRGATRTFVRYHDLLTGWETVTAGVGADLGLPQLGTIAPAARTEINDFVDPGLRRITLTWDDLDLPERLASLARDTWQCLDRLPGAVGQHDELAELDALHEAYDAYYLESEVVSRSSVIAVRQAAAAQPDQQATQPRSAARALGLVRRVPGPLRRLVPTSLRSRLLTRLDAASPPATGPSARP